MAGVDSCAFVVHPAHTMCASPWGPELLLAAILQQLVLCVGVNVCVDVLHIFVQATVYQKRGPVFSRCAPCAGQTPAVLVVTVFRQTSSGMGCSACNNWGTVL